MYVDPSRLAGEPALNEAEGVASATGVGLTVGKPSFLEAKPNGWIGEAETDGFDGR